MILTTIFRWDYKQTKITGGPHPVVDPPQIPTEILWVSLSSNSHLATSAPGTSAHAEGQGSHNAHGLHLATKIPTADFWGVIY